MDQITWHENYALGFPEIDGDHRALINIINEIIKALADRDFNLCVSFSETFVSALKEHYPREEEFLEEIGYTHLKEHAGYHRKMLEQAEEFVELCKKEKNVELLEERLKRLVAKLLEDTRGGDLYFRTELLEKGLDKALSDRPIISMWL